MHRQWTGTSAISLGLMLRSEFDKRAGEGASRFAAGKKKPTWDMSAAAPHIERIRDARGRNAGKGASPAHLMGELKERMWHSVKP
jgi:hypothetical protein